MPYQHSDDFDRKYGALFFRLDLSLEEREAIDWIGHRYSNGNDLFDILLNDEVIVFNTMDITGLDYIPIEWDWGDDKEYAFLIPQREAWKIVDNAQEEDGDHEYNFPCFCERLERKCREFCSEVDSTTFTDYVWLVQQYDLKIKLLNVL